MELSLPLRWGVQPDNFYLDVVDDTFRLSQIEKIETPEVREAESDATTEDDSDSSSEEETKPEPETMDNNRRRKRPDQTVPSIDEVKLKLIHDSMPDVKGCINYNELLRKLGLNIKNNATVTRRLHSAYFEICGGKMKPARRGKPPRSVGKHEHT